MTERTLEKARQVVHRLSEWYFAEGGDNDPDSPIDREDLDALHDLVRTPRGEEEPKFDAGDPVALRLAASKLEASGYDVLALRLRKIADQIKAARRSKAQGDAEALAALVVRIWTRCKMEGPHYRETDEFWADFERAYQLAALHSEAQGEDTIPVSALRSEIAQLKARGLLPYLAWARLCALAGGGPVGEDTPAALRSEAQGEDRWEDLVFGPIAQAYNEAHAARRGEGGGDGD